MTIQVKSKKIEDFSNEKSLSTKNALHFKKENYNPVPTDEELGLINIHTLKDLSTDEVMVFTFRAANTIPDRGLDQFDVENLKELGRTYVGKPFLNDHRGSVKETIGRVYAYELEEDGGVTYLRLKVFIPILDKTKEIISELETGIRKDVSVGFRAKDLLCTVCHKSYFSGECNHIADDKTVYDGGQKCYTIPVVKEAIELSSVYVGMQYNAQSVRKSVGGGEDMENKELETQIKELTTKIDSSDLKIKEQEETIETLNKQVASLDEIVKSLGEKASVEFVKELLAKSVLADTAMTSMRKEVERVAVLALGDTYNEKVIGKMLDNCSYEELVEFKSIYQKQADEKFGVTRSTEVQEYSYKQENSKVNAPIWE